VRGWNDPLAAAAAAAADEAVVVTRTLSPLALLSRVLLALCTLALLHLTLLDLALLILAATLELGLPVAALLHFRLAPYLLLEVGFAAPGGSDPAAVPADDAPVVRANGRSSRR
jgi:hypothetical protein